MSVLSCARPVSDGYKQGQIDYMKGIIKVKQVQITLYE